MVIEAISSYLQSLPKTFTFTQHSKISKIHNTLNSRTSVSVISIIDIDALYDYLMLFLLNMPFQTRAA
jgi:RNAse (barnase) inhibitor barstar